jgi:hypothetical protein
MVSCRISNEAKEDLIRIHHYGVEKFGVTQADKYFDSLRLMQPDKYLFTPSPKPHAPSPVHSL